MEKQAVSLSNSAASGAIAISLRMVEELRSAVVIACYPPKA